MREKSIVPPPSASNPGGTTPEATTIDAERLLAADTALEATLQAILHGGPSKEAYREPQAPNSFADLQVDVATESAAHSVAVEYATKLGHVRDWLDQYVRPFAMIEWRDELDRYSYEWLETGQCYEEVDGDVSYTVPVLEYASSERDEDIRDAALKTGFDCEDERCWLVVEWLRQRHAAICQELLRLQELTGGGTGTHGSEQVASDDDAAIYVGIFDDDYSWSDGPRTSGAHKAVSGGIDEGTLAADGGKVTWFPDGWTPEGYYEMCDEGAGIQGFIQEYGQDFVSHDLGLPNFLGDALVATSELGGAR